MSTIVDPFEKKEIEIKDPFQEEKPQLKDPFEEEIGVGENIYRTAVGALRDVAQGTADFTDWVEGLVPRNLRAGVVKTEEDGYQVLFGEEYSEAVDKLRSQGIKVINLPKIEEPTYFGGSFVRDVGGFIIPFSRLKMVTPLSKTGKAAEIVARGAVAEQLAFSPYEQRLSNLVQQYPSLQNPLTEYLQSDPEDTESEARFKMALEGVITGGLIEGGTEGTKKGIEWLAKTVRNIRGAKTKPAPKTKEGEPIKIENQPTSTKEKSLTENLQAISEPIEDVTITSVEAAPGLLGKNYQKVANKIIKTKLKLLIIFLYFTFNISTVF